MILEKLDFNTRSLLRSTYIITSLFQCVVELVENSLDAQATKIDIEFDFNKNEFQVVDNGTGISLENLKVIGNRYVTSKCHTIEDLKHINTYGFRGEALASIFQIADIEINTKIKDSEDIYSLYVNDGNIKYCGISDSYIKYESGTTVFVQNIFNKAPVRKKLLNKKRHIYDNIKKNIEILALIEPGIEFTVINKQNGRKIIHTNLNNKEFIDVFKDLYNELLCKDLISVNLNSKDIINYKFSDYNYMVTGFIGFSGNPKKYQYIYLNKRYLEYNEIYKYINKIFNEDLSIQKCNEHFQRNYNDLFSPYIPHFLLNFDKKLKKYPVFLFNISCSTEIYDICMDPSKRVVEFENWESILYFIKLVINNALEQYKLFACQQNNEELTQNFSITQSRFFNLPSIIKSFNSHNSNDNNNIEKEQLNKKNKEIIVIDLTESDTSHEQRSNSISIDGTYNNKNFYISSSEDDSLIDNINNEESDIEILSNFNDQFTDTINNININNEKNDEATNLLSQTYYNNEKKLDMDINIESEEKIISNSEDRMDIQTNLNVTNINKERCFCDKNNYIDHEICYNDITQLSDYRSITNAADKCDIESNNETNKKVLKIMKNCDEITDTRIITEAVNNNKGIISEIYKQNIDIEKDSNINIRKEQEVQHQSEIEEIDIIDINNGDADTDNSDNTDSYDDNEEEEEEEKEEEGEEIIDSSEDEYNDLSFKKQAINEKINFIKEKYFYRPNSSLPSIIRHADDRRTRKRKRAFPSKAKRQYKKSTSFKSNDDSSHLSFMNNLIEPSTSLISDSELEKNDLEIPSIDFSNEKTDKLLKNSKKLNPLLEKFKKYRKNPVIENSNTSTILDESNNDVSINNGIITLNDDIKDFNERIPTINLNIDNATSNINKSEIVGPKYFRYTCNNFLNHKVIFDKEYLKNLQVIGQADQKFIVCKLLNYKNKEQVNKKKYFSDLLVLLDQHAIDERIQLEALLNQYKHGNSQGTGPEITQLTPPIRVILPNHEIKRIYEFKQEFKNIGIYFVEDDFKYSFYEGAKDNHKLSYSEKEIIENYGSEYFDKSHYLRSSLFDILNKDSILDKKNKSNIQSNIDYNQTNKLISALSIVRVEKLPRLIVERCLTNVEKLTNIIRNCIYEFENSLSKYKNSYLIFDEDCSPSSSNLSKSHLNLKNSLNSSHFPLQNTIPDINNTSNYFKNKNSLRDSNGVTIQSFHFSDRKIDFIPSSIYSILCSLACHKAIKFDDPLTLKECRAIVEQMPSLRFPFQCAHGRPTMIPLINLTYLKKLSSKNRDGYLPEYKILLKKYRIRKKDK
ncbi:hypothetical protein BCR36DRAFT_408495 [Piromyces finnis]|uniref:DNA mismatch repair protein S5 domain-containing protein n=1 Tax=Piromyces finnis TaxID=1754191 RepID=A0A1Y1VND0_9FUNG|nr:hypothetical protein BCR36DRAFT_408495 [Piromyces finnis]|eukprot:ORX60132.1 hypothetical protein BCR36DRAFT_408495 [Piromyces finnis]